MQALRKALVAVAYFALAGLLIFGLAGLFKDSESDMFMPHSHCFLFNAELIRLHSLSDLAIGLAYVSISATLTYLVLRARREIPFHWMMLAFATFIIACGATHFMEVWTLYDASPKYWMSGNIKLVTAVASVATALLLPPLIPKVLKLLQDAGAAAVHRRQLEAAHIELAHVHERVKQIDALKTNFFANVSHEFRTPLTLIYGPVERLLQSGSLGERDRNDLTIVRRNTSLLYKHVTDLLDVAKLESGKMEVHWTEVNLAKLLRVVAAFFNSSHLLRTVTLSVQTPEELLAQVDAGKIERVMMNLVTNAIKFTPAGGSVRAFLEREGDFAVLIVDDSGPGIAPAEREAIFERFYKAKPGAMANSQGIGLGLSIVREFVQLHHGTVGVGVAPGGGARFLVRLPLKAPAGVTIEAPTGFTALASSSVRVDQDVIEASAAWAERTSDLPRSTSDLGTVTGDDKSLVLVVEDNQDLSGFIRQCLDPECHTIAASEGAQALELARQHAPDLIVTDMLMPGMSGQVLVRELKADATLADIPVIILTARADDELKTSLLADGVQDYVTKPFVLEELRARVRNQLVAKHARDMLQRELTSQTRDLNKLAEEMAIRARELARAKEAAESANKAKDRFLAVLSHELRTPLTAVLAATDLLEASDHPHDSEVKKLSGMIRRNVNVEARLIDDLLDLTRITRGKLQMRLQDADVHAAIRDTVQFCAVEVADKGLNLQLHLNATRTVMRGDPARLQQVFWNLLSNAVKFSHPGGRVTISTSDVAGDRTRIEVTDMGIGIEHASLDTVFEAFKQTEGAIAARSGGLGLGLAIARGLVEAHRGTISVLSEGPGKGATFIVEFHARAATPADAPNVAAPAAPPAHETKPCVILLVEDHDDTRRTLKALLTKKGYQVVAAGSIAEAHELANSRAIDLLLSDISLPDGSGLDLMQALQSRGPLQGIAMSGFGTSEDVKKSRQAGFFEHIVKPVSFDHLEKVIRRVFEAESNGETG